MNRRHVNPWELGVHLYFRKILSSKDQEEIVFGLNVAIELGSRALLNGKSADYTVHLVLKTLETNPKLSGSGPSSHKSIGSNPNQEYVEAAILRTSDKKWSVFTGINEEHPISKAYKKLDTFLQVFSSPVEEHHTKASLSDMEPFDLIVCSAIASDIQGETSVGITSRNISGFTGCCAVGQAIDLFGKGQGISIIGSPKIIHTIPFSAGQKITEGKGIEQVALTSSALDNPLLSILWIRNNTIHHQKTVSPGTDVITPGVITPQNETKQATNEWFFYNITTWESFQTIIPNVPLKEGTYHEATLCPQQRTIREIEMACPDTNNLNVIDQITTDLLSRGTFSGQQFLLFSPVSAKVSCVLPLSITLYLQPFTPHDVYAPMNGTILDITGCQGKFHRPELIWFQAETTKNARLAIQMKGERIGLEFWLEIGKKDWKVTDQMFLEKGILRGKRVTEGDKLGELVLGSMAEVHFPNHKRLHYQVLVRKGQDVIGARTPLVMYTIKSE